MPGIAICLLTPAFAKGGREVSEIELVDVVFGEGEGLAEKDVVAFDLDRLQAAGGERRIAGI
jgi:hypothetical protein